MPIVGDRLMLGPSGGGPVHWFAGELLWTDGAEVLVQQYGIAGQSPHKALHDISYVRCFGTLEYCVEEKQRASKIVRDAARQCAEIEDMASDLRRRLMDVFETVATETIKASRARAP